MVLVGGVILPHGTMSFDGQGSEGSVESCHARYQGLPKDLQLQVAGLFHATTKACEKIAELKPDIVILHTPHGMSLSKSVGVYMNNKAKGNALWNEKWDEFQVEIPLDNELALKLIQHFEEEGIDAQGINAFARTEAPLRWGEVVPVWYLEQQFKTFGQQLKYIILSQSMKRGDLCNDKMAIGKSVARFLAKIDARVVFAVSGDLSHAHTHSYTDIPLYMPDPRWNMPQSSKAVVFDRAIEGWATSCDLSFIGCGAQLPSCVEEIIWDITLAPAWLDQAIELQPEALSCGIGGFIVLHGILSQCDKKIHSQVFGRFAPTYYGMIAVAFCLEC